MCGRRLSDVELQRSLGCTAIVVAHGEGDRVPAGLLVDVVSICPAAAGAFLHLAGRGFAVAPVPGRGMRVSTTHVGEPGAELDLGVDLQSLHRWDRQRTDGWWDVRDRQTRRVVANESDAVRHSEMKSDRPVVDNG